MDGIPTRLTAGGDSSITERLLKGSATPNGFVFKVHVDGYNLLPYLEGQAAHSPRKNFFYFDEDGQLVANSCTEAAAQTKD